MFLHQSANLDQNLYHACDPWHMHHHWKIEHWEEEYEYTHIRVAHLRFRIDQLPHCHCVEHMGVSGGCGVGSGVGCLSSSGGGAPVALRLQLVWGFCAMSSGQGRQPSIWFSRSIAGCHSIAAFTFLCPGNSTHCFFSSRTLARGCLIRNCVSPIVARENPPLAILFIFKARRMSDCSSCTRPPCLAIVADMLKTYPEISCCIYISD